MGRPRNSTKQATHAVHEEPVALRPSLIEGYATTVDWPRPAPEPDYLTASEVARLLRLSRSTVSRLAKQGRLPGAIYVGDSIRIDRAVFQAFLRDAVLTPIGDANRTLSR